MESDAHEAQLMREIRIAISNIPEDIPLDVCITTVVTALKKLVDQEPIRLMPIDQAPEVVAWTFEDIMRNEG